MRCARARALPYFLHQKDAEFVPAEARDRVDLTHGAAQDAGDSAGDVAAVFVNRSLYSVKRRCRTAAAERSRCGVSGGSLFRADYRSTGL